MKTRPAARLRWTILQPMQEQAAAAPSSATRGFASLLAALATPAAEPTPSWDDSALADDIATLSYDQALRTHARFRLNHPGDPHPRPAHETGEFPVPPDLQPQSDSLPLPTRTTSRPNQDAAVESSAKYASTALHENRRAASVTIRLSRPEAAQLHARAAEAGLTISAYLRSCIFEAESLRAQVREALAQFRSASAASTPKTSGHAPSKPNWLSRIFPRWFANRRTAHP